MNFRILDLMILTGSIAALIAVFQIDKVLFRHLILLILVTSISCIVVVKYSMPNYSMRVTGTIGGLLAGTTYVLASYLLRHWLYELSGYEYKQSMFSDSYAFFWSGDVPGALIASCAIGSVAGPLLAMWTGSHNVRKRFGNQLRFSLIFLAAAIVLAFFAMLDRLSLFGHARNWTPLLLVSLLIFVIHSHGYLGQMEKAFRGDSEELKRTDNADSE